MKPSLIVFGLTLFSSFSSATLAQESRGLVPEDFYQEKIVEQTSISPDGELLAYTVMTIDEEENSRHREIWMQPLRNGAADGEAFRFTNSASLKYSFAKYLVFQL